MVGGAPGAGIAGSHRSRCDSMTDTPCSPASSHEIQRNHALQPAAGSSRRTGHIPTMQQWRRRKASGRQDRGGDHCDPTDSHYQIAKKFLESGTMSFVTNRSASRSRKLELKGLAEQKGLILCLIHNYFGYATVRHAARTTVRNGGRLGRDQGRQAEHASGWAATLLEKQGHTRRLEDGSHVVR